MKSAEQLSDAIHLAKKCQWQEALKALAQLDDALAVCLMDLFADQQQTERERAQAHSVTRHELGNLLSIAQANIEAMIDGVLPTTPERLSTIRDALQNVGALLNKLKQQ